MSVIFPLSHFAETRARDKGKVAVHNVTDRVKSWGRRGIFFGANVGFVLGAIFVAIPYTSDVLAFGTIGTLVVGIVECAFIAGAFAAFAAALHAKGVLGDCGTQFEHILQGRRRPTISSIPLTDGPSRWAHPTSRLPLPQDPDGGLNTAFSLLDAQARLSTIEAWENGNAGP